MTARDHGARIDAVINANEISGQIAIGENILQVGSNHGVIIYEAAQEAPEPAPRPRPVELLPRRPDPFLDREQELDHRAQIAQPAQVNAYEGPPGIGKSTLLRRLAHNEQGTSFPDGMVFQRAKRLALDDLLQFLFDTFYSVPGAYKPTPGELRHALRELSALIVLDDIDLGHDDIDELLDHLPQSSFVLATADRNLPAAAEFHRLAGLPLEDAAELFAHELDRPLREPDREVVRSICQAVDGHPLSIVQAARRVRQGREALTEASRAVSGQQTGAELALGSALAAKEDDRKLLAALTVVGNAPLSAEHLKNITKLKNARRRLERLQAARLVEGATNGYRMTGSLARDLRAVWGDSLEGWGARTLQHIVNWYSRKTAAPEQTLELNEAALGLLEWAHDGQRWHQVIRLGRAIDASLALTGRWGSWQQVLTRVQHAAIGVGDRATEAWCLHQLGSRALGLGELEAAQDLLTRAAELRGLLGDHAGETVSRHNLRAARGEPLPLPSAAGGTGTPWLPLGAAAVLLAGGIGASVWWGCCRPQPDPSPTVEEEVAPSPTDSPTPTRAPLLTATPTFTLSPPDLTVAGFAVDSLPEFDAFGRMLFPARVEIFNLGDLTAEEFKISTSYTGGILAPQTSFTVPFTVPNQSSAFYPRTSEPLAGGETVLFEGTIGLNPIDNTRVLTLTALADSCAGDELFPQHCRVLEANEENNSTSVAIRTPACFDFNDLEIGEVFEAGSPPHHESTGALTFRAMFSPNDDVALADGTAEVDFGWSQNLLTVRNLLLRFTFRTESARTAFAYSEVGGLQVIERDGERIEVKDFSDLDGIQLGTTRFRVLREPDASMGVVVIEGPVTTLGVGNSGGLLRVDNLCWMEVQE